MNGPDDDRTTSSFVRGLTLGAILGAIVAGSSIWSRWRRGRRGRDGQGVDRGRHGAPDAGGPTASGPAPEAGERS